MKTQIKTIFIGLIALGTMEANAQAQKQDKPTTVDLFTQVSMTQDFVGSMLDQLSTSSVDRQNLSKDYSIAAPVFQEEIKIKLSNFRTAITMVFSGSFSQMIQEYNQTIQDKNLSDAQSKEKSSALLNSITQMAKAVESSYQAQIKTLMTIRPELYVINWEVKSGNGGSNDKMLITFANGRIKVKAGYSSSGWNSAEAVQEQTINSSIDLRVDTLLKNNCDTQTCYSNLFNDYSSYFFQIQNFVNKDVTIKLADSKIVTIHALKSTGAKKIINAFSNYKFETTYTNLPFSN